MISMVIVIVKKLPYFKLHLSAQVSHPLSYEIGGRLEKTDHFFIVLWLILLVMYSMEQEHYNKKLLHLQRIALSVLVIVMFAATFFVIKNPAKAETQVITPEESIQQQTLQIEKTLPVYDLVSDTSLKKYLSASTPFLNIDYVPSDLQAIDSSFTANNSKKFFLRQEAATKFADMAWHFWNDFKGDKLWISSAYRSNDFQESMLKKWCPRARCALAWTSEHQWWLAVDLKIISKSWKSYSLTSGSIYYKWFVDNAHLRWFHNTYQKWIEVDGQMQEPRHRRYVSVELATELHDKLLTFAQYFRTQ